MNWELRTIKVKDLIEWSGNPRKISREDLDNLKQSFIEFGHARTLTVAPEGKKFVIIGGNQSLKALKELDFKEIQCSVADREMTEQEKQKLSVFLNHRTKGEGEWDYDILNTWDVDFEDWGIEQIKFETEIHEAKEDDYEIPSEIETDIVLGDLFEIGEHRLMCGDSTDSEQVAKLMNGENADMVMTDPPYNVDYGQKAKMLGDYDKGHRNTNKILNDNMDNDSFYAFLLAFYKSFASVTKIGGGWYVWHSESESYNFRKAFMESGLMLKQCLIWVKSSMVMGRQDYQWKHEPCLYGWKPGAAHYFIDDRTNTTVIDDKIELKKLTKAEMLKMLETIYSDKTPSTVIYCDKPYRSSEHPTMKPILLLAPLIENSSKPGWIIADAFLGSGSTMVAAHQLNRKCYGMELDPKYCQVIIDRMQKLAPDIEIKKNGKPYKRK